MDRKPPGDAPVPSKPVVRLVARNEPGVESVHPDLLRQAADWQILLGDPAPDAQIQARFEAWLDQDAEHVRAWALVSEAYEALGELPRQSMAPPRRSGTRRALLAAAAVLVLTLAAIFGPAIAYRLAGDIVSEVAEVSEISLPDGSSVRLAPQSVLRLDFGADRRRVSLLAGTALFDVVHDAARPFRVDSGEVNVTVLGTAFEVSREEDGTTAVAVARGHVRVTDRQAASPTGHDLLAGQSIRIGADHAAALANMPVAGIGAWADGRLVARNETIGTMVGRLRPWFGGFIILRGEGWEHQRIDGVFDAREPRAALTAMVVPYRGHVTELTPFVLLAELGGP